MKGFINKKVYVYGQGIIRANVGIENGKIAYIGNDNVITEEIKITVIATGFCSPSEQKEISFSEQPVKPVINFTEKEEDIVPPLIREYEEQQAKLNNAESEENNVVEDVKVQVNETVQQVEPEKKGKELPAFMRRLFKNK